MFKVNCDLDTFVWDSSILNQWIGESVNKYVKKKILKLIWKLT